MAKFQHFLMPHSAGIFSVLNYMRSPEYQNKEDKDKPNYFSIDVKTPFKYAYFNIHVYENSHSNIHLKVDGTWGCPCQYINIVDPSYDPRVYRINHGCKLGVTDEVRLRTSSLDGRFESKLRERVIEFGGTIDSNKEIRTESGGQTYYCKLSSFRKI